MNKLLPRDLRSLIRSGKFQNCTAGVSEGFLQANVVILPDKYASQFEKFCLKNPKPCPLLEVLPKGVYETELIAQGADIRTDVPKYRIYSQDKMIEADNLLEVWKDDCVTFFLGCSFSWEEELQRKGVSLRHINEKLNVSMYETNISLEPVFPFEGHMVVSMRPILKSQVDCVRETTEKYPLAHGGPLYVGSPENIGIKNISQPEYGDRVDILDNEDPMYWGCGVTSMKIVRDAVNLGNVPYAFSHSPGHMFVADIPLEDVEKICRQ